MMEERIVIGENTKYPLNGLLTLPVGATNPVPAVVFVHGSGASNMDEKVGKLTPFKEMFWAYHTPKMRRVTCPKCGHKGLCVEVYDDGEKT